MGPEDQIGKGNVDKIIVVNFTIESTELKEIIIEVS